MSDIETQVRSYAAEVVDTVEPVTADEARARARHSRTRLRLVRAAAAAAAIALTAGVIAVISRQEDVTTAAGGDAGGYPLTLDGHRDWQLALFDGREPTDDEIRSRLTEEFLAAVPPAKFRETVATIRDLGPWRVLAEIERREDSLAVQLAAESGQQARLTVAVDPEGRLAGSTVLLATPCAPAVPSSDVVLDAPLADQIDWYLALINSQEPVTEGEITAHFAPTFLDQVGGAAHIASAQTSVRALGPFTKRHYEGQPATNEANLRLGIRSGEEARLHLIIEPRPPHRIVVYSILTQQPCVSGSD